MDGSCQTGEFGDGDLFIALASEEDGFISHGYVAFRADVDDNLIHTDTPGDGPPFAADEDGGLAGQ